MTERNPCRAYPAHPAAAWDAARENRRLRRVMWARLRKRTDAFGRWWLTLGRALVSFSLAFVALLPMAAFVVGLALGWWP